MATTKTAFNTDFTYRPEVADVLYAAADPETRDVLYTAEDPETQDVFYTAEDQEVIDGVKNVGDLKTAATANVGDVKTAATKNVGDVKTAGSDEVAFDSTTAEVEPSANVISKIQSKGVAYTINDAEVRTFMGITKNATSGKLESSVMDAVDGEIKKISQEVIDAEVAINKAEDAIIANENAISALESQIENSISGAYVYRGTVTEETLESIEIKAVEDKGNGVDTYFKVTPAAGENPESVAFATVATEGYSLLENGNVFNVVTTDNADGDPIYSGMNYAWNEDEGKFDALGSLVATAIADGSTKSNANKGVLGTTTNVYYTQDEADVANGESGAVEGDADFVTTATVKGTVDGSLSNESTKSTVGNDGLLTSEDKSDLNALKDSYNITAAVTDETLVFTATNLISGDYATL